MCQPQVYNFSGDGRAWSRNGELAETQSPNPTSAKVQGHSNLNMPSHCTSLGPAVPPHSCEVSQDTKAAFSWRFSPEEQPQPIHQHPMVGELNIRRSSSFGLIASRYVGEVDQADKTVLPWGVKRTNQIISILYRTLPKWCSILFGWATYYSVKHTVISIWCRNSGISLSTWMILSNLLYLKPE